MAASKTEPVYTSGESQEHYIGNGVPFRRQGAIWETDPAYTLSSTLGSHSTACYAKFNLYFCHHHFPLVLERSYGGLGGILNYTTQRVPKGFFGCPHRRSLLGSMYNPPWKEFHMEPKRVLPGTKRVLP
jgi:hypothetical protein